MMQKFCPDSIASVFMKPLNSQQQKHLVQAETILRNTPLRGQDFLYLPEDVFHMLWQKQYGKLRTLYAMARSAPSATGFS